MGISAFRYKEKYRWMWGKFKNFFYKIQRISKNFLKRLENSFKFSEENDEKELIESIYRAQNDWMKSEKYFQCVSDPDLVDHAIYTMEATKIKYMYLVKKAKEKGVKLNAR